MSSLLTPHIPLPPDGWGYPPSLYMVFLCNMGGQYQKQSIHKKILEKIFRNFGKYSPIYKQHNNLIYVQHNNLIKWTGPGGNYMGNYILLQ